MKNTPQQVTERYVSNLLHFGRNKEFDIVTIDQKPAKSNEDDEAVIGFYYNVWITDKTQGKGASGATPSQAVRRALEKHGVTFR